MTVDNVSNDDMMMAHLEALFTAEDIPFNQCGNQVWWAMLPGKQTLFQHADFTLHMVVFHTSSTLQYRPFMLLWRMGRGLRNNTCLETLATSTVLLLKAWTSQKELLRQVISELSRQVFWALCGSSLPAVEYQWTTVKSLRTQFLKAPEPNVDRQSQWMCLSQNLAALVRFWDLMVINTPHGGSGLNNVVSLCSKHFNFLPLKLF